MFGRGVGLDCWGVVLEGAPGLENVAPVPDEEP